MSPIGGGWKWKQTPRSKVSVEVAGFTTVTMAASCLTLKAQAAPPLLPLILSFAVRLRPLPVFPLTPPPNPLIGLSELDCVSK